MKPYSLKDSNFALRIATAMKQHGIPGLPRYYELVYEAYSGNNMDLTREFLAAGPKYSPKKLDGLCQKHLQPWLETATAVTVNDKIQQQLSRLITLLEQEKHHIAQFAQVLDQTHAGDKNVMFLGDAVREAMELNEKLKRDIVAEISVSEEMEEESRAREARKFKDAITDTANRRAFLKHMSGLYVDAQNMPDCTLTLMEIDNFNATYVNNEDGFSDSVLRTFSDVLTSQLTENDFVARLEESRFAVIRPFKSLDESGWHFDKVKTRFSEIPVVNPMGFSRHFTISGGIALSRMHTDSVSLTKTAENALGLSKRAGGNQVSMPNAHSKAGLQWHDRMIYREH